LRERYDIWRPPPPSLRELRDPSDKSFPENVLEGCRDALVLFAQAWYGKQDAVYVANAGLVGTCVDARDHNFQAMRELYPAGWEFVKADVYQFVEDTERTWDVVTVDCPSGHFQRCADLLAELCSLATRAVVLGSGAKTRITVPGGWVQTARNRRSTMYGGVYWTVLERA